MKHIKLSKIFVYFLKKRNPNFKINTNIGSFVLIEFIKNNLIGFLRFLFLKIRLKINVKGIVIIKSGIKIYGPKINLGNYTIIEENVRFQSILKDSIYIGQSCRIGFCSDIQSGLQFSDPSGIIKICDNVAIGAYSHIGGAGNVTIGSNSIIGPYFSVHSENHSFSQNKILYRLQDVSRKGIIIGENCWIGAKVTILDGVKIGNNCVIAAGSVVTKSFSNNNLLAGVPAKVLKKL